MESYVSYSYEGGIKKIWIRIVGRSAICAGFADQITEKEGILFAETFWKNHDELIKIENSFRKKNPKKQIYMGYLPTRDTDTILEGYYMYVISNNKIQGKYKIKDYVKL
jgi:hypothetical protein